MSIDSNRNLLPGGDGGHACPARRCSRDNLPASILMCRSHWYMVPRPLRNRVWDAYQDGAGIGTAELRAAQIAAINAVNAKLDEAK